MREISRRDVMAVGAGMLPLVGLAGYAMAQTRNEGGRGNERDRGSWHDAAMSACLLIKGRRQIEVCRMAMDKLQHDDCKKFAQAEIDEHEHIRKKLDEMGYQFPTTGNRSGVVAASGTDGGNERQMTTITVGRATLPADVSQVIGMDLQILEQCLTSARSEMGKLQGMKFDKCFIGDQLHAHYGLFDHAVVFRKNSTHDLAAVLDEGRPIIEKHISMCKSIMDKLEGEHRPG